jgi:uncharacterized protein
LEFSLLKDIHHESMSLMIIKSLNKEFNNQLDLALKIFTGKYERKFFHQLVSSQLDIDRLDYLQRDCYFTGVSEGTIGADRIIKMMNIKDDALVIEEKGIYSIENFLSARRLMYWQVYLHKTTVSAEKMLINLISRAKDVQQSGVNLKGSDAFIHLLQNNYTLEDFKKSPALLEIFTELDDYDIWGAVKQWKKDGDYVLNNISNMFLNRNLFKIDLSSTPFEAKELEEMKLKTIKKLGIPEEDISYFFSYGSISNNAYVAKDRILIYTKKGKVIDVAQAADLPNIKAMSKIVKKHYACRAKNLTLPSH